MTIYSDIILDHSRFPRNYGSLKNPTQSVEVKNPLCGDEITMEVIIRDGIVKEVGFIGQGCAISTASASLLSTEIVGKTTDEIKKISKEDVLRLLHVDLSPNRLKCALLSLEALKKLLMQKE